MRPPDFLVLSDTGRSVLETNVCGPAVALTAGRAKGRKKRAIIRAGGSRAEGGPVASKRIGAARGRLSLVGATPAPVAADLVDHWLAALAADDRSPATIRAYRAAARGFLEWYAGEEGRPALLADLTTIAIQGWRVALQHGGGDAAPRATATVNARLAGLRAWCAWLRAQGHLADDPAARVKLVGRGAPAAPEGLEGREAAALLRAAGRGRHGVRDVAIVQALLQTGLRIGECAALDLEDLVVGERGGRLTVRAGKGNKARAVPLNGSARAALAEYVAPHLGVAPTLAAVARAWPRRRPGAAGTPLWRSQKGGRLGVSAMRRAIDGVAPLTDDGRIDLDWIEANLTERHRLVALCHISNALGSVLDAQRAADLAHGVGAKLLLDGCQSAPRLAIDVQAICCDFYVFSGHKLYGPTGIGVLWAKGEILDAMPPWQGGGSMIDKVTFARTTYAPAPGRFEAGTPHIVGAVGLHAAIDYVNAVGVDAIERHERTLAATAREALGQVNSVRLFGPEDGLGIVSFAVEGVHPHDIATILDEDGVAIRAGHHCCQPLMDRLGVPATARASFGIYSDESDIEALMKGVERVRKIFG